MRFEELSPRAARAADDGREVVSVLGLGYVGTAVCASLTQAALAGRAPFFVVAVERDDAVGRPRMERLLAGEPPVELGDDRVAEVLSAGVAGANAGNGERVLTATVDRRALGLSDIVVVCINLDVDRAPGQTTEVACDLDGYAAAMRDLGAAVRPGTLVLIETTLPVGASERVLYPALCEGFRSARGDAPPPAFGFCYERVMPGAACLESVHAMWRSYAGIDDASAARVERFLAAFIDTDRFPLHRHKSIRAAELAKLMENAYRATNIAFIEEWAQLAEEIDVDLFDVVRSIKARRGTHDNMMRPGLGVGGRCVTKDSLLAAFGARELFGVEAQLPFSDLAILTNEGMPLRAVDFARAHYDGDLDGRRVLLCGVTYLPGVADTRSSPTETVARALLREGCEVHAIDDTIEAWPELTELPLIASPAEADGPFDVVVLCLPEDSNRALVEALWGEADAIRAGALVVDAWDTLGDALVADLAGGGVAVSIYGRGDLPRVDPDSRA